MFVQPQKNTYEVFTTLAANEELRVCSKKTEERMTLQLLSGKAEIFGAELELNKVYSFSDDYAISVFSYVGCRIRFQVTTNNDSQTALSEFKNCHRNLLMVYLLNIHTVLEQLRERADVTDERGPIVMIVGPKDVGKSTLTTMLTNYAVRMACKRTPVYVETDPGQSSLSLPGTIGAALITNQIQPDKSLSQQIDPLIYNVGSTRLGHNPVYKLMISKLASTVLKKLDSNKKAKSSGLIINMPGWTQNEGYDLIKHTAQAFEVDIVLVLHQKSLFDGLKQDLPYFVKVVQVPKLEGARFRTQELRWEIRDKMLKDYFYGANSELKPYVFDVPWAYFKVFKVRLDESNRTDDVSLRFAMLNDSLKNHVLAVTFAQRKEDALESNISGFVCVIDVHNGHDVQARKVTLLSPFPPPLPDVCFLVTSLFLSANSVPNNGLQS